MMVKVHMAKFTSTTPSPDDEISQLYRILSHANEIASNTELDDLLDQMLDLIIEVCGGNAGTLYLLDSEHGELEFKVIRGPNSDQSLIGKRIKTNLGIVGATMKQSQPLVIEDLVHDPRWQKVSGSPEELRNVISIPLCLRAEPIGVCRFSIIHKHRYRSCKCLAHAWHPRSRKPCSWKRASKGLHVSRR